MPRIITDRTFVEQQWGILPRKIAYGSRDAFRRGMYPVDDQADVLINEDEWQERINDAHEQRTMPLHHLQKANAPARSQGRTNFCWAYGMALAVEGEELREGKNYIRLAPATLGWLVNWRNKGYYLSETIRGAAERGIASSKYAPDGVSSMAAFKPGWKEDALSHRPSEWWDTIGKSYSVNAMVKQCVSLILNGLPGYIAYNWWGHALAMVGVRWNEKVKNNIEWIAWNSHGDGVITITGDRGVPDEFYALRATK